MRITANQRTIFALLSFFLFVHSGLNAQSGETAQFSSLKLLTKGNDGAMQDFAVSRDQRYLVIANEHKVIKLFDGRSGKFIKRIIGQHDQVIEISLLPKGDKILTAGFDNTLAIINISDGKILNTFSFPVAQSSNKIFSDAVPSRMRSLDINEDGSEAVVGDNKGNLYFIDLNSVSLISQLHVDAPQVSCVRFSSDFKTIAVGTGNAMGYMLKKHPILLINASTRQIVKQLSGDLGATTALCFSSDGNFLYSGHKSNKHNVRKWDLQNGSNIELKANINLISNSGYTDIALDQANKIIMATTDDNSVEVYDLQTGEALSKKGRGKIRLLRKLDHFPRVIFPINKGKYFVIGGFDQNLLYLFNTEKRGITGFFHSFNDEWAVVAADGRMDGSTAAIHNLVWKEGESEVPLENTFDQSFTPKLMTQLIAENGAKKEFEVKQVATGMPELKLAAIDGKAIVATTGVTKTSSIEKNVKIKITVEKNASQVKELRLYQNSKLVSTQANQGSVYLFDVGLTDAFGEDNFFFVTAKTNSGVDSEKKEFIINYKGKTSEQAKLYLFTIGINQYKNPKYNLNYALADANEFESTVKAGAGGLFAEVVTVRLRDGQALKKNIVDEFNKVKAKAKEQDMFVFYYAGHGVMSDGKEKEPEFYLVPNDVTQLYGRDDVLKEKGIAATELREISKYINAQKQVFILDACQSAGALDAITSRGAAEEKAIAQLARSTGTFWITSSGSQQFATEFKDLGHGVFTYSLIEGLKGKADNGDKRITIKELSSYIEVRVPELSEKYNGSSQYPSGYSYGNDFPVVIVR